MNKSFCQLIDIAPAFRFRYDSLSQCERTLFSVLTVVIRQFCQKKQQNKAQNCKKIKHFFRKIKNTKAFFGNFQRKKSMTVKIKAQ